MKDIITRVAEDLQIISDYNNSPEHISYLMQPLALRCFIPIPEHVKEALIRIEKVLYDATLNDSASLQTILNEFGARLSSFHGTIAHVAAQSNIDSLQVLIDKLGERVLEALDSSGQTVTSHAAKYNTKSLELLIDRFGEKVLYVKDSYGYTPLHLAAIYNRDSFELLIETLQKTDLFTVKNNEGNTALHVAIQNGNGDLLQSLIEKHPEIAQSFLSARNIKGNTPLHFAAEYDKDFFAFLIEKFGEKILEVKNNDGETAWHVAAERNKESLALLIEKFPEIIEILMSETDAFGQTALHLAAWHHKGSLELLIEKFPETIESLLSAQDKGGHTPLHLATGNEGAFKLLIEKFPEQVKSLFNVENEFGKTVLKSAQSRCADALPKEYQPPKKSCIILGNESSIPIPGIPESFSSYYQDQVSLLLKLRLEDTAPGALKLVDVLEANYTLNESNQDNIAEKLSSFILASHKNSILMPLNIGGRHLVGIVAAKDGNNIVIHYMDSEQSPPPKSLFAEIESMLESHSYSMELKTHEVERQKYSNCGPEVIENLAAFASKQPRASQEEAILKHSIALERHLLKDSDDIHYTEVSIPFASTAFFSSPYALLDEKLIAQLQHYLRTGEAFDTARAAIEDGAVHITHHPFMLNEVDVANTNLIRHTQTYNEESYNDGLEALNPIGEFSPGVSMVAMAGLLCSFLVISSV